MAATGEPPDLRSSPPTCPKESQVGRGLTTSAGRTFPPATGRGSHCALGPVLRNPEADGTNSTHCVPGPAPAPGAHRP